MFSGTRTGQQRYGSVAVSDSSDSDRSPPRPVDDDDPHAAFIETLRRIQDQQKQTSINTWTCWGIRASPILATALWTGSLFFLLFAWIFLDKMERYTSSTAGFPTLSEVIAHHSTITLLGSISTAVFLIQSLEQERFLRFKRVLTEATEERWLWCSVGILDCILGVCGSVALFLLPIFDVQEFPQLHKIFKTAFFVCIALSGLLNTVEVEHLWHEHPDRHDLRVGTFLKYTFLWLFVGCGVTSRFLFQLCHSSLVNLEYETCYRTTTASAIFEWVTCLSLSGFFSTLALDVWPTSRHVPVHPRFSASSQGLSHIHHGDDKDSCEKTEIPPGIEVRRLPMMTRTGIVGYGNGWRDRTEEDDEDNYAYYGLGKGARKESSVAKRRRKSARSRHRTPSSSVDLCD
ncbi:hypothetical protein JCM16303_005133 [Sporobolomyces ruberrimus]